MIVGKIPIELLGFDQRRSWKTKRENLAISGTDLRYHTLRRWQSRWNKVTSGKWTGRLIPSIAAWIRRNFGEINYFLNQFLSGHGYFRQYLYRMFKVIDPGFIYCEMSVDAEHIFFHCIKWQDEKTMLILQIDKFIPDNIVDAML